MTPDEAKAAIEALKNGDGAAALAFIEAWLAAEVTDDPGDAGAAGAPPAAAGATAGNADAPPEMQALARGVLELFGADAGAALTAVRAMKADADKRASDAALLEGAERRGLIADLVKLGVEVPATAWVDPEKTGAELAPVERLAKEDLPGLRRRVSLIKSTRAKQGASAPGARVTPPAGAEGAGGEAELTDVEREHAAQIKDPEARKRYVARRLARRSK
jgi:hypothetical protein